MDSFLIFLSITLAVTASPGPAVFLAIKNSIHYGNKAAVLAILGNIAAMLTLASLSAIGLGALILASSSLFLIIKLIGGLYLVYLGLRLLVLPATPLKEPSGQINARSIPQLMAEAYLVGISNPKAIAFYVSLFPQFIAPDQPLIWQLLPLASTFACCSFGFLVAYALLAGRMRNLLQQPRFFGCFNRGTGMIFVALGSALMLSNPARSQP